MPVKWVSSAHSLASFDGKKLAVEEHGFTHFTLSITPFLVEFNEKEMNENLTAQQAKTKWLNLNDIETAALPAPVKRILLKLI